MVIFASNMSKDELIEKEFNVAVVDRITQHCFRVPPLRERPEDIAIFINNELYRKKEQVNTEIAYFDLAGLRLICELPWEDNYRGIKGLIEDLLAERARRKLTTKTISFDEVIGAIRRRELIGRISATGKE